MTAVRSRPTRGGAAAPAAPPRARTGSGPRARPDHRGAFDLLTYGALTLEQFTLDLFTLEHVTDGHVPHGDPHDQQPCLDQPCLDQPRPG